MKIEFGKIEFGQLNIVIDVNIRSSTSDEVIDKLNKNADKLNTATAGVKSALETVTTNK